MNLASQYVPFLRSAPPSVIRALGLAVVLTLALAAGAVAERRRRSRAALTVPRPSSAPTH